MAEEGRDEKYVQLRDLRGKLFPAWVLLNFRKYRIPEIFRDDAKDPCERTQKTKDKLEKYQAFIGKFLDFRSIYRDILIYHGVGSGKTAAAINVYNLLYNYSPNWNVFVLIKASLRNDPWMKDLRRWLGFGTDHAAEDMMRNVHFVHYDSPFAHRDFLEVVKRVDASNKNVYMIDEVHNFIGNVMSNKAGTGVRAKSIYDYILAEKEVSPDTRVIAMSATPLVNDPFELAILFNLLRPGAFPTNENEFYDLFVSAEGFNSINYQNKQVFQRRIMGLVSYYIGTDPAMYAKKRVKFKELEMSKYQQDVYRHFEGLERRLESGRSTDADHRRAAPRAGSSYRTLTRQACNFVFPFIDERVNGESRPRPADLAADQNLKQLEAKEREALYQERLDGFLTAFRTYVGRLRDPLDAEVDAFLHRFNGRFAAFHKQAPHGETYRRLYECSPKMLNICFNVLKSRGPCIVFSNFVRGEGLELMATYLEFFGFSNHFATGSAGSSATGSAGSGRRYIFYSSDFDREKRSQVLSLFNAPGNIRGDQIRVILISPAATEGISFLNVRQIHMLEPHWNETRMLQIYGRGVRKCSHSALPLEERVVDIYRYKVVRPGAPTTDEQIERLAMQKQNLVDSFTNAMKEVAIDCELFKADNMVEGAYRCFSFPVEHLLQRLPGPAYRDDVYEDVRIQRRSSFETKKLKVYKVRAVRPLEGGHSDPQWFWMDFDTLVLYDYDFHIPVARAKELVPARGDQPPVPERLDANTFLIDAVLPVPML